MSNPTEDFEKLLKYFSPPPAPETAAAWSNLLTQVNAPCIAAKLLWMDKSILSTLRDRHADFAFVTLRQAVLDKAIIGLCSSSAMIEAASPRFLTVFKGAMSLYHCKSWVKDLPTPQERQAVIDQSAVTGQAYSVDPWDQETGKTKVDEWLQQAIDEVTPIYDELMELSVRLKAFRDAILGAVKTTVVVTFDDLKRAQTLVRQYYVSLALYFTLSQWDVDKEDEMTQQINSLFALQP